MLTSHSHLNMKIFNESDIRPENYFPFVYKIMNYDLVGWQAHRLGLWRRWGEWQRQRYRDRNLNRILIFDNILSHSVISFESFVLLHRSISCDNIWNSYPDSWCNIVISTMVKLFYTKGEKFERWIGNNGAPH